MRKEQYQIPQVEFVFRESGEFVTRTSAELFDGKVAVAQVTLNRANHPKWSSDLCKVVYQKNVA